MTAALTAIGLTVASTDGNEFRDLDLTVERGETLGLTSIGFANFRGLLETLAGLRRPAAGKVVWGGLPALDALYDSRAPLTSRYRALRGLRRTTGYVSDTVSLINNLTVFDNVALPLRYHFNAPERTVEERTEKVLELLGLAALARERPTGLSLGAKRRAALARALILDPTVLFLDSPFSDIDNDSTDFLVSVLTHYSEKVGLAIVVASYEPRQLLSIATRVFVFRGGAIVEALAGEALSENRFPAELARIHAAYRS